MAYEVAMALEIDIPGFGECLIYHIVFDLNGTLAQTGVMRDSTRERLQVLSQTLALHVITADTHGALDRLIDGSPLRAQRIQGQLGAEEKRELVRAIGAKNTVAVGNGRNDAAMLSEAAIGLVICGAEGVARDALLAADVLFSDIDDALDSLIQPRRLLATLRG